MILMIMTIMMVIMMVIMTLMATQILRKNYKPWPGKETKICSEMSVLDGLSGRTRHQSHGRTVTDTDLRET